MSASTHYLLQNAETSAREVHTASNARDLLMHTKYRLILKGDVVEMKRSLKDALSEVETDENGKVTSKGSAQLNANMKAVEAATLSEDENKTVEDEGVSEVRDDADDDIAPIKVIS